MFELIPNSVLGKKLVTTVVPAEGSRSNRSWIMLLALGWY